MVCGKMMNHYRRCVLSAGAPSATASSRVSKNCTGRRSIHPMGRQVLGLQPLINMVLEETTAKTNQGLGTCVGHLAPNMTVRIIKISDEPISEWSDDRILRKEKVEKIVSRDWLLQRNIRKNQKTPAMQRYGKEQRFGTEWEMSDTSTR